MSGKKVLIPSIDEILLFLLCLLILNNFQVFSLCDTSISLKALNFMDFVYLLLDISRMHYNFLILRIK